MSDVYEIPVLSQIGQVHREIEKHGGCTAAEISEELGIPTNSVNTQAQRLREQGKVRRVKLPGQRAVTWWPGEEPGYIPRKEKDAGPKRRMVSEWEPCTVRDPLLWLSYGVNPQPVQEELL